MVLSIREDAAVSQAAVFPALWGGAELSHDGRPVSLRRGSHRMDTGRVLTQPSLLHLSKQFIIRVRSEVHPLSFLLLN